MKLLTIGFALGVLVFGLILRRMLHRYYPHLI